MLLIDRYIARNFLGGYFLLTAAGLTLYVLLDLLVNIDEFTEDSSVPVRDIGWLLLDFYGHNLPLYYSQVSGAMLSLAGAFCFGAMLRNRELVALAAAGVPLQRLLAPVVLCSILLVGLWVANRELLIPEWSQRIARTHDQLMGRQSGGVYCTRDANNAILTAMGLNVRAGRLERVYLIEPTSQGIPDSLIEADAAQWDEQRKTWRLERGRRIVMRKPEEIGLGDPVRFEPATEYPYTLSPGELSLRQSAEWAELLSVRDMNTLLQSPNWPNRPTIEMARHVRLTSPLVQWILVLLPLPYFLTRSPASVIAVGGKALLATGLFFAFTFICHGPNFGEAWAALAAWAPILLFGPIVVLQLANIRT